jgi:hypothetical protein
VESTAADLSSIETMLADLIVRLERASGGVAAQEREDLAGELLEVQRVLESARRRLGRISRSIQLG